MVPASLAALFWAASWVLPTAVVTPMSMPAATAIAAAGLLLHGCTLWRYRGAGLLALPTLLAGIQAPAMPMPPLPIGPAVIEGTIASVMRSPTTGTTQVFLGNGRARLRLVCDGDVPALPGDRLRTKAWIAPPCAPGLPPTVRVLSAAIELSAGPWSPGRLAAKARAACERQLLQRLPGDTGGMVAALVLGRETRPAEEIVQSHRATGLSHLLAVSGAHAAMLAWLLGFAGWRRGRQLGAGPWRTIALLLLLAGYAAMTGNEPPVLRAIVAFGLASLATHTGRPFGMGTGLLAPAMLTAFVQPDALLGPSFLLSYAAVIGLWLAGPPRSELRTERWLWSPLRASLWATLLTAPFTLWFFGQLAPWTIVLTPLLAPFVGLLLVLGLALAIVGNVAPLLADLLAWPLAPLADLYAECVALADLLPGTPIPAMTSPAPWLLALATGAAALLLARSQRRRTAWGAVAMLVAPYFVPHSEPAHERFVLFAVGHGQCGLVTKTDGHQTAIDCGSLQQPSLAHSQLTAALARRRLDLLVITHADADHHAAVATLLTKIPIATAVLPTALADSPLARALRQHGANLRILAAGEHCSPAPHLRISAPALPAGATDNDQSLWVSVQVGSTKILLTGDAQELGTAAAIADGIATAHDVLVLPHHGRPNANAPWLLRHVRPRACLASAGLADGDTALGAIARRFGAELWITGQHGTLWFDGASARLRGTAGDRPLAVGR